MLIAHSHPYLISFFLLIEALNSALYNTMKIFVHEKCRQTRAIPITINRMSKKCALFSLSGFEKQKRKIGGLTLHMRMVGSMDRDDGMLLCI